MRRGLIVLLALAALAIPASASASVKLISVTSPASPGSGASLVVKVSKPTTCNIIVMYKSGSSQAQGLYPKRPVHGIVSWGAAGALQTSLAVS